MVSSNRRACATAVGLLALALPLAARAAEPGPDALPIQVVDIHSASAAHRTKALTDALRGAIRAMPGWSIAANAATPGAAQCAFAAARPRHWSSIPPTRVPEKARALIYAGDDKLAAGDAAGALAAYQAGDDIMRVPTTGLAVARALAALGRFAEAADIAGWAAAEPVQPNEASVLAEARRDAEALAKSAAKRAASVRVVIGGQPIAASTAVFFDGVLAPAGDDPATRLVNPGKRVISVVALGYRGSASVILREGDRATVSITLTEDPPSAECQSRVAAALEADRWVWGTLEKKDPKGSRLVANLHFWVRGKGATRRSVEIDDEQDEALRKAAATAMHELTGGPPNGEVRIRTSPVIAQVLVDGAAAGALRDGNGTFTMTAGAHTIRLRASGFVDHEARVIVRPGAPVEISPTLERLPWMSGKRIAGLAVLGGGVAAGVVGLVSALQVKSAQSAIEKELVTQPPSFQTCDPATYGNHNPPLSADVYEKSYAATCTKGKTFQALQIVMFPLAAIAGGVGIFLIATGGQSTTTPKQSSWTLVPMIGPGGGALGATFRF